jgi:hypothetical protein
MASKTVWTIRIISLCALWTVTVLIVVYGLTSCDGPISGEVMGHRYQHGAYQLNIDKGQGYGTTWQTVTYGTYRLCAKRYSHYPKCSVKR